MSEPLKSMLRNAADDHPDLMLRDGDPWRRGRRIRLRRRLAGVAGATVTAAAVVAGAVLLTTPDLTSTPEPAQEEPSVPALPDALYEVPPNIPDISDDPLGEPAAVVHRDEVHIGFFSDATHPIVVGADSGNVRAVRAAPEIAHVALSPDGTRLAVAQRWTVTSSDPSPPTVVVVDLFSGETSTHTLPDNGLGGGVENLTWAPGNTLLTVTAIVTTGISDDGTGGSGDEIYGHLDSSSGKWHEDSIGTRLAFSSDGTRTVAESHSEGMRIRTSDAADPVEVDLSGTFGVAFSPGDDQIAAIARYGADSDRFALELFDAGTGDLAARLDLGEYADVSLIGWGERGLVIDTLRKVGESADGTTDYGAVVERIDLSDLENPLRTAIIEDLSEAGRIDIAGGWVDADTREASPPDAGFDWVRWVPDPVLLVVSGILATPLILVAALQRRRRLKTGLSQLGHSSPQDQRSTPG